MHDYDVIVVGSGFGGSVAALRLTEKGYRVGVLEAGRRFDDASYPTTSWDLRNFLWAPALGCTGLQRVTFLKDVTVLSAAGVGGGSLVYANTLYEPLAPFYEDPQWSHITDWRDELAPHYDQARRMLGVVTNPLRTAADDVIEQVAQDMGVGETFHPTPVGVFFGPAGTAPGTTLPDPFFGGAGPERTTCLGCGSCMTGCRHGAKNTLDRNYLHLAEAAGARVHPLTTVSAVVPLAGGGYRVDTRHSSHRRWRHSFTAGQVVLAAGTYNTQKLLHRMKDDGLLPGLSDRLGLLTRTNSESILSASRRHEGPDFSRGVAITSSFHPDDHTHIEPVRYGRGSNSMGLLQTALSDGGPGRWKRWAQELFGHPRDIARHFSVRRWSERTVIMLVMQTLDNSITVYGRRRLGRFGLSTKQGHGEGNPSWIPAGNDATRRVANKIDGIARGSVPELAGSPITAHFIGGATIGDSPSSGVIDPWHRVYGHEGLHVVDGAAISANLGVNPSLTITAQAERAFSYWPNQGDADPRPALGSAYVRGPAIAPVAPVVPAAAPAALRLVSVASTTSTAPATAP